MSSTVTPSKTQLDANAPQSNPLNNAQLRQWKARIGAGTAAQTAPGFFSGEFIQETLALTRRLFIQLQRRPSTLAAGIIQPLMWLILFGALFQNVPQGLFGESQNYGQFLGAGIIVFTAFGGALNAGLPVMFDREFGFLNRLLVAPLASRFSIVMASAIFIATLSLVQTAAIVATSAFMGAGLPGPAGLGLVALIVLTLVLGVTALSLGLSFALPGHIELIAVIFVTNLPLLFASTALVPLSFMPDWLQTVASLNPLSYAIEPIRYLYLHSDWTFTSVVMQSPWGGVNLATSLLILVGFSAIALASIQPLLRRRMS
ncbi:MAG: ABC transporter permease [Cyanothece sp. SIO1E1]|nr:ABC transporter permease [Cyanothece sp. SIO1E1]